MIAVPMSDIHRSQCAKMMALRCALRHTDDTRYVCWISVRDLSFYLSWCVAFEGWLGKTCRVHMARDPRASPYAPRRLIHAVFDYAFNQAGLELLFGIVDGADENVVRFDEWLGFKRVAHFPGVHMDDHDLLVFAMWKNECRFLKERCYGRKERTTCS